MGLLVAIVDVGISFSAGAVEDVLSWLVLIMLNSPIFIGDFFEDESAYMALATYTNSMSLLHSVKTRLKVSLLRRDKPLSIV